MNTRNTYLEYGVTKDHIEKLNNENIHNAFMEKVVSELDKLDLTNPLIENVEDFYSAIDYKLNGGSYIAKKLLEIAKSDDVRIDYNGILIDLDTYNFKNIVETLKKDVNNYEGYKTKDNRKNRQEKYYAKHPEKRPQEEKEN